MPKKILCFMPVYFGVVILLILQLGLNIGYGTWLWWFIVHSEDHKDEISKTLVTSSIGLAIWECYAAFVALVGLHGALGKRRYMKNFNRAQGFVWIGHIGICTWYLITFQNFARHRSACLAELDDLDEEDDSISDECQHVIKFKTIPLIFVWMVFGVEALIQTALMIFLFFYGRELDTFKIVEQDPDTVPLRGPDSNVSILHSVAYSRTALNDDSELETGVLLGNHRPIASLGPSRPY